MGAKGIVNDHRASAAEREAFEVASEEAAWYAGVRGYICLALLVVILVLADKLLVTMKNLGKPVADTASRSMTSRAVYWLLLARPHHKQSTTSKGLGPSHTRRF